MKRSLILTALSFLVLAQLGLAQVPQTFNYQGVLKDNDGNIVADDNYDLAFRLYDDTDTQVWEETHSPVGGNAVWVENGTFSVILGEAEPLPDPFPSPAKLGIKVGADAEMTPRIELTAAPYSLNARVVTGVDNFFPGTGRVGIGTPNPQSELHVARGDWILGSSSALPGLGESAWLTSGAGILYDAGGADWAHHFSAYGGGDIARFGISAGVGQAPDSRVVIANSGFVGIGTADPTYPLDVQADIISDYVASITNTGTGASGGKGLLVSIADSGAAGAGDIFAVEGSGKSFFKVTEMGRVGIGIINPYDRFSVLDTVSHWNYAGRFNRTSSNSGANGLYVNASAYSASYNGYTAYGGQFNASGSYAMAGMAGGGSAYGILCTVKAYGTSSAYGVYSTATQGNTTGNKYAFYGLGSGYLSGFWTEGSDARWKTNVKPLTNVLDKLDQVQGVSFEWNKLSEDYGQKAGDRSIGVLAQELEKVYPELILTVEDGYKSVAYTKLTAVLIEAVKELKAEKDALERRVAALETTLAEKAGSITTAAAE